MDTQSLPKWLAFTIIGAVAVLLFGAAFFIGGSREAKPLSAAEIVETQQAEKPGEAPSGDAADAQNAAAEPAAAVPGDP